MDSGTASPGLRQQDLAGIKALLERRCGSAAIAEDLLGDAIETALRKLRDGEIARPELLAGYVYRVALNHLRNFRRSDKSSRSVTEGIEALPDESRRDVTADIEQARWARMVKELLEEMDNPRDRALIVGFYLEEEDKSVLCRRLGLSAQHFNRVIHRARERFRELVEGRGLRRSDFLGLFLAVVG
jgi:RNA polymerase sigma-70 factor (ECF subfamily)